MSQKKTSEVFYSLTPAVDIKLGVYAEALDHAFCHPEVKNVAVTGPYGSGKSSVLESYKKQKGKTFIHISLAHFDDEFNVSPNSEESKNEENKNSEQKSKDECSLEGKILNQLIHQINPKNIPQTHFKVKRPFSKCRAIARSVLVVTFLLSLLFLLNQSSWRNFVDGIASNEIRNILSSTTSNLGLTIFFVICVGIIFRLLYCLYQLQHNKNWLKKLNVQGNEIEIFDAREDSVFNKYLNEILYIFRKAEVDAIVFEDMDRYNSSLIFKKLREINYLLNNCNRNKKIFRFIYLIKDDIFTSKDRTKFFDLIIPIVPIIHGGNSGDVFIGYFKSSKIIDQFDDGFLQDISLYVDDMRLLKNIYNEYLIYHGRLKTTNLNNNKLLAIIVYKNLFPKDFSDLILGQGYVDFILRNKGKLIEKQLADIDKDLLNVEELLERVKKEKISGLDELDALFITGDYMVNSHISEEFPSRVKWVRAMKENPNEIYSRVYNSYSKKVNLDDVLEKLLENSEYSKRKRMLSEDLFKLQESLQQRRQTDYSTKRELHNASLSELIQRDEQTAEELFRAIHIDEIGIKHDYADVKGSLYFPLIKYLLRNDYIDEYYSDYTSYFYEQSMSRNDKNFIFSVIDAKALEFDYSLDDPVSIVSRLNLRYYSRSEVMNFDLFAYLLRSMREHRRPLRSFLDQLKKDSQVDFVLKYLQSNREQQQFFENINKAWPSFWLALTKESIATKDEINKYLVQSFYHSPLDVIQAMNIDNAVTNHIESSPDFLSILEPNISLITQALRVLDVRFESIDYDVSEKELFNAVYRNDCYEINQAMISMLLEKQYQISDGENYWHKNFSFIMSKNTEPLVAYIDSNIDSYVGLMLELCDEQIVDDEQYSLIILNHPNVSNENKSKYIDALQIKIEKLDSVKNTNLWDMLISHNLVPCSKENILSYYFEVDEVFDETLINFINGTESEIGLSFDIIEKQYTKEKASDFYRNIIKNDKLKDQQYESILLGFGRHYSSFSFEDIDDDKINILIKLNIIKMNTNNMIFIREHYPSCKMAFIIKNIQQYVQDVASEEDLDIDELMDVLTSQADAHYLIKLLSLTSSPIPIEKKDISETIKKHILTHNYYDGDLRYLISEYESSSLNIKTIVHKLCLRQISEIITDQIEVPYDLLEVLLQSSLDQSQKEELFANQLQSLTCEQATKCFTILEMNVMLDALGGYRPLVEISEINADLLDVMINKAWISSYGVDRKNPDYYRVIGNRRRKHT